MTAISIDNTEYHNIINHIVETYPDAVDADPFKIAITMIMSPEILDGELTKTYGTDEYMSVSLYPLDVFSHTDQTAERIDNWNEKAEKSDVLTSHVAFELDLIDAYERKQLEDNK